MPYALQEYYADKQDLDLKRLAEVVFPSLMYGEAQIVRCAEADRLRVAAAARRYARQQSPRLHIKTNRVAAGVSLQLVTPKLRLTRPGNGG